MRKYKRDEIWEEQLAANNGEGNRRNIKQFRANIPANKIEKKEKSDKNPYSIADTRYVQEYCLKPVRRASY